MNVETLIEFGMFMVAVDIALAVLYFSVCSAINYMKQLGEEK